MTPLKKQTNIKKQKKEIYSKAFTLSFQGGLKFCLYSNLIMYYYYSISITML